MAAQMRNFLDQTGGLWVKGALVGKVGSVFTSTGTGGGNESTIISFVTTLMHHGMVYVGLPYACPELADISEVKGGSPWGAATIAGADGSRQPSAKELARPASRARTSRRSPPNCAAESQCHAPRQSAAGVQRACRADLKALPLRNPDGHGVEPPGNHRGTTVEVGFYPSGHDGA